MTARKQKPEIEAYKIYADDWSEWIAPRKGYRMICCDCNLVHQLEFDIGKNSKTGKRQAIFRVRRDDRFTASMRKKYETKTTISPAQFARL
jgi:hypothetical protein